jgi:hypothetical protein
MKQWNGMAAESDADQDARDLADCRPGSVIKGAAGAMAFSGVGCLMLALQGVLLMGPSRSEPVTFALAVEALLGILLLVMAIRLLKVRLLTTIAAALIAGACALTILALSVFALSRGLLSLLGFAVPGLCVISSLLALSAIGSARRAGAARQRLRARGISLGL